MIYNDTQTPKHKQANNSISLANNVSIIIIIGLTITHIM